MRKITILTFFTFIGLPAISQQDDLRSVLYKLEDKIVSGDIDALKKTAEYLDNKTFVQEFLGYHNYPNTARGVAIRIISENCLLSDDEFKIDSTISTAKFLQLANSGKLVFDDLTGMFLVTKLHERSTNYELKMVTDNELKRLDTIIGKKTYHGWYYENQIDGFLITKNPELLKWIASAWFKTRTRFNKYYFNDDEFTGLIKKLTHIELGVPDENGRITFLYKDDYSAKARLQYLVYWTNHYNEYRWNEEHGCFENIKESGLEQTIEERLFELLNSEDDSIAIDAYAKLTQLDTGRVIKLANDYEANDVDNNYSLPTFLYSFIEKSVVLTQYFRDNGIKYIADGWLKDSLEKLKGELSFKEQYCLENNIINRLQISDVTAVEYFGLINQGNWVVTYSVGRVVDKIYSKKFEDLASNKLQLEAFLKKSKLFDRIGIIGNFNKYLRKFENCSPDVISKLKDIAQSTVDFDVRNQANKAVEQYSNPINPVLPDKKRWIGSNNTYGVQNLSQKYVLIIKGKGELQDKERKIKLLFGQISYVQIPEAIKLLLSETNMEQYDKFHFIESDFGFDIDIEDEAALKEFIKNHKSKTEYQMCEYYLKQMGIDIFNGNSKLDYRKIFEVLKYDIVDAFAGGGGGRRQNGVYLVIKLLELEFKTTLAFPKKLCSWQGMYACYCDDRAKAWMQFLEEKKLVEPNKDEPPSISYNN